MNGVITRLFLPRGFGFIRGDDGKDYFLQVDELKNCPWSGEILHSGVRVRFDYKEEARGARAINVYVVR